MKDFEKTVQTLAERWSERSPKSIANQLSAPLFGTPGEWDMPADVTPQRDLLYLAVGIPDAESLPKAALKDSAERILAKPGDAALRYGFGYGPANIRSWLAERRNNQEGTAVDESWFQMTNGSSGAIDLIVRSIVNPGDVIIAENPTYMGTLHNFRGVGAEIRYVGVDDNGLKTDELATLLRQLRKEKKQVKLIYTISTFQNPSGVTLSEKRREHLISLACEYDTLILDDEAYRELWFDTPPPQALSTVADYWGVITTGSFSKTLATGLRAGWIHARPELLALFSRMRFAMGANQFGIRTLGDFLVRGEFEPHLDTMRQVYRDKRDALHTAMQAEVSDYLEWTLPAGGFYIWANLQQGMSVNDLWRTGIEEGIAVNPGTSFSVGDSVAPSVRIAFPWTPIDQFPEAAHRLRIACERVVAGDAA